MRKRKKSSLGFTLVEMLVALVMAGAVVTPLYVITRGVAEQTGAKQQEIEAMQRARIGMDTLIRDFSRVGLFASPNTMVDTRLIRVSSSTAEYRLAAAHLNAGETSPDKVLLAGNFLGSSVYQAFAESETTLLITDTLPNSAACTRQFDARYAFLHITDSAGRELDAKVATATVDGNNCRLTFGTNDRDARSFKMGDSVLVAASQTVVYQVEGDALVRYFAAYNSAANPDCTPSFSSSDVVVLVTETRQVIASYVTDFQVWFRAVTNANGWVEPHYPLLNAVIAENGANFVDGLVPPPDQEVILMDPNATPTLNDGTCTALQGTVIGPERIRSAVIRLTVRTEKSNTTLRRVPDNDATRLEQRLLAADTATPTVSGDDPYAFMLRTMTTEVEMPNLTARSDLLP